MSDNGIRISNRFIDPIYIRYVFRDTYYILPIVLKSVVLAGGLYMKFESWGRIISAGITGECAGKSFPFGSIPFPSTIWSRLAHFRSVPFCNIFPPFSTISPLGFRYFPGLLLGRRRDPGEIPFFPKRYLHLHRSPRILCCCFPLYLWHLQVRNQRLLWILPLFLCRFYPSR